MSIPTQRNSSFTAEYTPDGRQLLNQGVAEGVTNTPAPPPPPPPPTVAPGPVSLFQITEIKTSSLTASWGDSTSGDPAASFTPMYRVQGTGTWIEMPALAASVHAYSFFGLSSNVPYELAIKSTNSAGNIISTIIVGTTLPSVTTTPPGQVIGVGITSSTSNSITTQYSAPTGGAAVDDYIVEYKQSVSGTWLIFPDGVSSATSALVSGLIPLTSYDIRITAYNNVSGLGQPSAVVTGTTGAAATVVPNAPTVSSQNQAQGPGTITINIAPATTGQPATSYIWERKLSSASVWTAAATNTSTSYMYTGLTGATNYDFRITPVNAAGNGAALVVSNVFIAPTAAPTKVTGVTALSLTTSSIRLTWDANPANQFVTSYKILYRVVGQLPFTEVSLVLPATPGDELNISPLQPATAYEFLVQAFNAYNNGINSGGPTSDLFATSTLNNSAYTATNLGIGVNWSDAGDPQDPGVALPRTPQQSYWTLTGRTNPPLWMNKSWIQIVRLPFNWEAIQPTTFGPLDATEFANLKASVTLLLSKGKKILVDCHNFGRHNGFVLGSATLPTSALADLWVKLAGDAVWKNNQNVFFNLMNEPAIPLTAKLVEAQNLACAAIRNTGATNPIVASGNFWSGARNWTLKEPNPTQPYNEKGQQAPNYNDGDWAVCVDFSSAEKMHEVYDPGHNLWWDVHQYFDSANAGGSNTVDNIVSPATLTSWMDRVTTWARTYGQRCILGETGGGDAAAVKTAVDTIRAYVAANSDVWGGIVWWPASWRMQYAGATTPPIQNMYKEDQQPGFISNQEYWIQGLNPPGGGVVYPTKAQINMLPVSNTLGAATAPNRANIGGWVLSDNPWGVDNSDGTGALPNGWSVQVGANALSDGSISTRIIWNFPTTTPNKDTGPEITAFPEIYLGDENGVAPQSTDTYFPRAIASIGNLKLQSVFDASSTSAGEGQLTLDLFISTNGVNTITGNIELMIPNQPFGGYGVPNSPAGAIAGRTGESTGRNMSFYVGRHTIGGVQYDALIHPLGDSGRNWRFWVLEPVTFPAVQVHDLKAILNWAIAQGYINASAVVYAVPLGVETRPRMTRASSGDILYNTKWIERT